jgi:hypothetical protein
MHFFAVFVVALLGFFIPGILLWNLKGEFSINFMIMFFIVVFYCVRLVYTSLKGRRRLSLMFFYIFSYVFMGIQPLLSIWSNNFPHKEFGFAPSMISFCLFVLIIGILGFELGYYRFKKNIEVVSPYSVELNRVKFSSLTLVIFTLVITAITIQFIVTMKIFGPEVFLGVRGGGISLSNIQAPEATQGVYQLVIFGLRALSATLLFLALYIWRDRKHYCSGKQLWYLKVMLIYLVFINLLISNPLNAPRLWFGSVFLTSLFISLKWKGTGSFLSWSAIGCLGMLFLFSGMDPRLIVSRQLLRGEGVTLANTGREIGSAINNLPGDFNFDAFQMIYYTTLYTSKMGYSYGNQLLLPAFFWFPRSIWTSKPIGSPDIVASHADFVSINVSSPLWSEGYINFGIPGVFFFIFVFGYFARLNDNVLSQQIPKPPFQTIVASYFAANTIILLRGDLTTGTMYLQMIIVFSYIFLLLIYIPSQYVRKAII